MASHVAKTSGILKELYEDKTVEGLSRYENVQELLNAIKEFVDNPENEDKTMSSFLQTVSLLTNADEADDDGDTDRITLMTIHGAKGLEFKNVYVVGLEEGLFPSQMMLEKREDLEEERRLFYVAITRAETKLTFSYAESRYNWGRLNMCEPSRFLYEVDQRYLTMPKGRRSGGFDDNRINAEPSSINFVRKQPVAWGKSQKPETTPSETTSAKALINSQRPSSNLPNSIPNPPTDFVPGDTSTLEEGNRVEHPKFGKGTVKKMDVNGTDRKAVIHFDVVGEKTLLLSFAKLRILR